MAFEEEPTHAFTVKDTLQIYLAESDLALECMPLPFTLLPF